MRRMDRERGLSTPHTCIHNPSDTPAPSVRQPRPRGGVPSLAGRACSKRACADTNARGTMACVCEVLHLPG